MCRGYVGTSLDGKSVECVHAFPREVLGEGNSELYFVGRLTLLEKIEGNVVLRAEKMLKKVRFQQISTHPLDDPCSIEKSGQLCLFFSDTAMLKKLASVSQVPVSRCQFFL